jgi:SagB-type dehydrogenase family enzyme
MHTDIERTGYQFLKQTAVLGEQKPPGNEPLTKICGICEPEQNMISLPPPSDIITDPFLLRDTLDNRQTIRDYSEDELFKWELSLMLHYTQGVREKKDQPNFRTVPSAGALHPFETILAINRVSGIEPGLYRYLPLDHALVREVCHAGDKDAVASACRRSSLVTSSAVTFLWTAVPARMIWKFGSRGWRYLFIEAGHICENLYIISSALNLGVCAIGSYNDDKINCILGINGTDEFCIYVATVGRIKK